MTKSKKLTKPIAIITARSGSKGLPDKNMLFLAGKPVLVHSIDSALESGMFTEDRIYVSTDSLKYKQVIENLRPGVKVLLRRPELATDEATSFDVLSDFLQDFDDQQVFMLLQPTSPFRDPADIVRAFDLYSLGDYDSIVSYSQSDKPLVLFTQLDDNQMSINQTGKDRGIRRQNFAPTYYVNGSIYLANKQKYIANQGFLMEKIRALITSCETSLDIDHEVDFKSALGQIFFDHKKRGEREKSQRLRQFEEFARLVRAKTILISDYRLSFLDGGNIFHNLCVRGLRLSEMIEKIDCLIARQPQKVILALGVNDLIDSRGGVESLQESTLEAVNLLRRAEIEVVLCSIPLTLFRSEIKNHQIRQANEILAKIAEDFSLKFCDLNEGISQSGELIIEMTVDGSELSERGKQLLSRNLMKSII